MVQMEQSIYEEYDETKERFPITAIELNTTKKGKQRGAILFKNNKGFMTRKQPITYEKLCQNIIIPIINYVETGKAVQNQRKRKYERKRLKQKKKDNKNKKKTGIKVENKRYIYRIIQIIQIRPKTNKNIQIKRKKDGKRKKYQKKMDQNDKCVKNNYKIKFRFKHITQTNTYNTQTYYKPIKNLLNTNKRKQTQITTPNKPYKHTLRNEHYENTKTRVNINRDTQHKARYQNKINIDTPRYNRKYHRVQLELQLRSKNKKQRIVTKKSPHHTRERQNNNKSTNTTPSWDKIKESTQTQKQHRHNKTIQKQKINKKKQRKNGIQKKQPTKKKNNDQIMQTTNSTTEADRYNRLKREINDAEDAIFPPELNTISLIPTLINTIDLCQKSKNMIKFLSKSRNNTVKKYNKLTQQHYRLQRLSTAKTTRINTLMKKSKEEAKLRTKAIEERAKIMKEMNNLKKKIYTQEKNENNSNKGISGKNKPKIHNK
eukprot:39541_1